MYIICIYIYICIFHHFLLSNIINCNSIAYIAGCKSTTYCSFKFIFFLSDLNLVFRFSILIYLV